jgi:hypothetical protein
LKYKLEITECLSISSVGLAYKEPGPSSVMRCASAMRNDGINLLLKKNAFLLEEKFNLKMY